MNYRVWMDHSESDTHCWASDMLHTDFEEARRECEQYQETNSGDVEFEIINLKTGYPYYLSVQDALNLNHRKVT